MEGGGGEEPAAGPPREAEMEAPRKQELLLLADEKFDFDLSLSSLSAEEDNEVFFGPVGHKERCIAASLELNSPSPAEPPLPASGSPFRWSPLSGEKFVEVYKEARLLALQIESSSRSAAAPARREGPGSQAVERFIQEARLKMDLFEREHKAKKSPSSLKRETYYLADSPLGGPPAAGIQPPSGAGPQRAPAQAGLPQTQGPPLSSCSLPVEPSPAHPPNLAAAQKKVVSKLPPPRGSSVRGRSTHSALEKPTREKPASPSRTKTLSEKEPHRDMPPDKPSTAQDATSLPSRGSHLVQGKRSLPVPNKVGPKKTLLKPPGCAVSLARKPRSRGSVSGVSTSVCTSPAAGTAKSSECPSVSAESSRPPSNPSQPGRAGATAVRPALQAGPAAVCGQSRCPGLAEPAAEPPPAPATPALPQPRTPEQGGPRLNAQSSLPRSQLSRAGSARRDSILNSKSKGTPAPTNQFKIPKFPGEPPDSTTPRFSQAQRPQSCASAGRVVCSTPARCSSGLAPRTPVSTKRMSCLPTPASRRLSGLPWVTPKTMPRTLASPLCASARRLSSEPRRKSAVRPAPGSGGGSQAAPRGSAASPGKSFSPRAVVPQALRFSPEKGDVTVPESSPTEPALDEGQPPEETVPREAVLVDIQLDQLRITPKAGGSPLADYPLIDFGNTPEANVALGSESRPLIDLLVNTPDTDRNTAPKPLRAVGQLIDLCSPLIQLSPEANKENMESPLLKF